MQFLDCMIVAIAKTVLRAVFAIRQAFVYVLFLAGVAAVVGGLILVAYWLLQSSGA